MEHVSFQLLAQGFLEEPLSTNSRSTALKQLEQAALKLLAARQNDQAHREAVGANTRELAFERARLEDQLEKSNTSLQHAQKEQKLAQNLRNQAVNELNAEKKAHSQTRDDLTKNRLALQYVKSTAAQESKRKEREWTDTMSKISGSSSSSASAALQNMGRPPTPSSEGERALLETALEDLEGIRQALLTENEQFRVAMGNSIHIAEEAVKAAGASPRSLAVLVPDIDLYPEPHLTLPPHVLAEHLTALLEQAQSRLAAIEEGRQQAEEEATQAEQQLNTERINGHKHIADLQLKIAEVEHEASTAREKAEQLQTALDKADELAQRAKKKYRAEQERVEGLKSELSAKDVALQMEKRQTSLKAQSDANVKAPEKRKHGHSRSTSSKRPVDDVQPEVVVEVDEPSTAAIAESSSKRKRHESPDQTEEPHRSVKPASAMLANVVFNSPRQRSRISEDDEVVDGDDGRDRKRTKGEDRKHASSTTSKSKSSRSTSSRREKPSKSSAR